MIISLEASPELEKGAVEGGKEKWEFSVVLKLEG